jgi:large subunit ribosomal protein L13
VIIVNAEKIQMTGNKWTERTYFRHSGYPGGQKTSTPLDLLNKKGSKKGYHPLYIKVVKGMLPKNKLGAVLLGNMFVYEGATHPHEAQKPKKIDINSLK